MVSVGDKGVKEKRSRHLGQKQRRETIPLPLEPEAGSPGMKKNESGQEICGPQRSSKGGGQQKPRANGLGMHLSHDGDHDKQGNMGPMGSLWSMQGQPQM